MKEILSDILVVLIVIFIGIPVGVILLMFIIKYAAWIVETFFNHILG